ncbi:putative intraflagellar transport protein 140 [Tribonema minus]|uniref:Putative intraflagellar transport protein 140 n=1 Tax=Tribonema minus TaxID=303371 RepID=A0A835YKN9_9STRA|nr:putative intraflagellar transport protein 140 [Tribonema minus]
MSSLFFDYKCSGGSTAAATALTWCKSEYLLAVAAEDGHIYFYQDEGVVAPAATIVRETHVPTLMDWHKKGKTLAVGWADGQISLWSVQDQIQDSRTTCSCANGAVHRAPVTLLLWNPAGTCLVTGDAAGTVCVWKCDSHGGTVLPLVQYRKKGAVTAAVFCGSTSSSQDDPVAAALSPPFFFATDTGTVCYADDLGHCTDIQQLGSCVDTLMFYEGAMRLIVVTRSLLMVQLQVADDAHVTQFMKVKLSVSAAAVAERGVRDVAWAGPGLLAAATGEGLVRLWDLANDESYVLSLANTGLDRADRAISIAFDPVKRYLAVGTKDGHAAMWRFIGEYSTDIAAANGKETTVGASLSTCTDDWEPLPTMPGHEGGNISIPCNKVLKHTFITCAYHSSAGMLAAAATGQNSNAAMLSETVLHSSITVVATRMERIAVLQAMSLSGDTLVILSGKQAQLVRLRGPDQAPEKGDPFPSMARAVVVDEPRDQMFLATESRIDILNLAGGFKSSITCTEGEGNPVLADVNGSFLAIATDRGVIKLFDVSKREKKDGVLLPVRPLGSAGRFVCAESGASLGVMRSIRCNADGTRVSVLSDRVLGSVLQICEPDPRLHIYDADKDMMVHYDFAPVRRYPTGHCWDAAEPKLLACETRRLRGRMLTTTGNGGPANGTYMNQTGPEANGNAQRLSVDQKIGQGEDDAKSANIEITTLFVSAEHGPLMQDGFALEAPLESLLGIQVPHLYFTASVPTSGSRSSGDNANGHVRQQLVCSRIMRDFAGLDSSLVFDEKVAQALVDFSYYLTVGDMDHAYAAVRLIRSPSVWENMAHMCVKTKRLDVAEVCLGNMGYARGAAAVRLAKEHEPELEARIAQVAIQLGLLDDAVRLYTECSRYDLLVVLYRSAGLWERALATAEAYDQIHLRATHHLYAKHLEGLGDTEGAIKHYEDADTHRTEVPRMLLERGRLGELEAYIASRGDPELVKWWAKYCESIGDHAAARLFYARAADHLSLVRLACYAGDMNKAAAIVRDTGSVAAAYHLARQHEGRGEWQEAVALYARSRCYNHAMRLAKSHGMDAELMSFAMQSRPSLMVDAAQYFEDKGELDKAVQLYHKGGDVAHALEICFKAGADGQTGMFELLRAITEELGQASGSTNPQVLVQCAQFFLEHGQAEKAVSLYISSKQYRQALDLCATAKVKITEEMAESITPSKDAVDRTQLLQELAQCCKRQGSYHLACKKYTQAGERLKAMKCLLKTGDTKSIIYYASVGRSRDMYVLAANYLQNLDWHSDAEVMRSIVSFYTKAKAMEQLSGFYEACAQVEIDEYRNYEKALGALHEAQQCLSKANTPSSASALSALHQRVQLVQQFVAARRMALDDPPEMLRICHRLLEEPQLDAAVRTGDCCAQLVNWYAAQQDWRQALALLSLLRERNIPLRRYINMQVVAAVCKGAGVHSAEFEDADGNAGARAAPTGGASNGGDGDEDEDEVGEDVNGEDDDSQNDQDGYGISSQFGYRK